MKILTIELSPPLLDEINIKEKISCIRGHRERLFNISFEQLSDKLVFHNYGHGGAGYTFLFGCVNETIRQLANFVQPSKPIAVIGVGCYGLLTAVMLARNNYNVKIYAKDLHSIPSYKAAGFFFPRPRKVSNEHEKKIFLDYGIESYKTYLDIINSAHPFIKSGVKQVPAYYSLNIDPGFEPYIAQDLIEIPKQVKINFGNNKTYDAVEYRTIHINSTQIMAELQRNIKELGIEIIKKEINNFNELEEKIIFNCTGLGAKKLANDNKMVPIQGHLITLKNQTDISQLQYMLNFKVNVKSIKGHMKDELIYFAPKDEGLLGITFLRGQDNENANQYEFDRLLERCENFYNKNLGRAY